MPVIPVNAPAAEISQLLESIATVFKFPPIATAPVEVPVAIFTGKFDDALRFTAAPVTVNPLLPVMSPVEVNVPAPRRFAPLAVNAVVPPGARMMLPVEEEPKVKVCLAVVASVPVALRY